MGLEKPVFPRQWHSSGTQADPAEPAWADSFRGQATIHFLETPSVSSLSHKGEQDVAGAILRTPAEGGDWLGIQHVGGNFACRDFRNCILHTLSAHGGLRLC